MSILKPTAAALLIALLAGCTAQPRTAPAPNLSALEARARAQAETGNTAAAAALYRELADAATGPARAGFLLDGAALLIDAGDRSRARAWLTEAAEAGARDEREHVRALRARIELEEGRPEAALELVAGLEEPMPTELLTLVAGVRGRALLETGRLAEGVAELVEREIWLDEPEEILANQRLIWDGLAAAALESPPGATGDRLVDGWLALAPLAGLPVDSSEFRAELLRWRSAYVDHPAAGGLLAELLLEQRGAREVPRQVALLLPLSSPQRDAAVAIRDGFLAAHLARGGAPESSVDVYDTAAAGGDDAYLRAQLDGADFIVGPLLRPEVDAVVAQSGFVPTLALNFSQEDALPLSSLYQFALWPEDEAAAVARHAIAQGHRTAIALVASDDWGYRLLDAFREEFESLGGRLLDFAGFDPNQQDFSGQITTLLNLDRSNQRRQRLAANLGVPVEFEPRRRRDVDMIFLGADAQAGRLLAPQLRFYFAGDLPTYATREIHETSRRSGDSDLDGVLFPDAPIVIAPDPASEQLKRALEAHWPGRARQWIRFYGLGYDAYGLMLSLYDRNEADWPYFGASGALTLDARGRIHRSLPFAQFRNGRPVQVSPAELPPVPLPAREAGEPALLGAR